MDGDDVFVWPDGSMVYRHEYDDLTDRWRGDDFEILYVGTTEYNDFFDLCPEGGPDEDYWPDSE